MPDPAKPLNPNDVAQLDDMLRQRYSKRFHSMGADPRSLGWDTRAHQWARFEAARESVDFDGRSVLDIGCGLADFYDFLMQHDQGRPARYTGFDITSEFVAHCQARLPDCHFEERNVLVDPPAERWDIVTAFGLANLRLQNLDNVAFARTLMQTAFSLCGQAALVDMLTDHRDPAYPEEGFVYYYDPAEMLRIALDITPHVAIRHDRPSIPQREMLIVMKRAP